MKLIDRTVADFTQELASPAPVPGCGAILCKAAMQAASLNVFINTKSMKDRPCAEALEEEANALLAKYTVLGDTVYNKVTDRIRG